MSKKYFKLQKDKKESRLLKRNFNLAQRSVMDLVRKYGWETFGVSLYVHVDKIIAMHSIVPSGPSGRERVMAIFDWCAAQRESSPSLVAAETRHSDGSRAPSQKQIDAFYASWDWKRLRYDFLKDRQRRCQCCGATPADGIRVVVDHVKPIRKFWKSRLDINNLQLLCDDCNMGKGSRDTTDWRDPERCVAVDLADDPRAVLNGEFPDSGPVIWN